MLRKIVREGVSSMDTSSILDDFNKYRAPSGLISGQLAPLSTAGNAILYTAEELWALEKNGACTPEHVTFLLSSLQAECEVSPGLYSRGKCWNDQESIDDYMGLAYIAKYDPTIAQRILKYGRSHYFKRLPFYYRNQLPYVDNDVHAWLGRFQQLITALQWQAGEKPPFWRVVYTALVIAGSGFFNQEDQDSWVLCLLLTEIAESRSWLCRQATKIWRYKLKRSAWGSMKRVFTKYFDSPLHPVAKYAL